MTKKINLLLDEPCPELLCGVCTDVLEDPIQVHCPEDHMFCSKCIHSHVEYGQATCPLCFTMLDKSTFQLSKFVTRQIGRLRIQCAYSENGCPWQGLFSDNHISECEYKPCRCPNADNGCTATDITHGEMQHHMDVCLYQEINCPNNMPLCVAFLRKDLPRHENECQSYTCPYATEGCTYVGSLTHVRTHCDAYCGRLHKQITDLELECKRLNGLIGDFSLGLNMKLPSTPEDKQHDTSMDEMALFHQMFNSDPFGALDLNDKQTDVVDLNGLPDLSFLDNSVSSIFDTASSPQPLEFIPPVNVPKRTSNGKKIRYSKNVRLAHSALRIARQRTATTNPSNDAILNNLDIAKQKNQITFKNMDDVTHFLNTEPAKKNKKDQPSTPPPPPPQPQPQSQSQQGLVPKRRPMFILASSYLSNYNTSSSSSSSSNNTGTNPL
ncbi:hypothetical protein INT47_013248 [Mucor saturninus]|uniref:Uncharacterized protein n=1 Tax=Mucor saturninus TaxID=64648 RepID=A0A8H7V2G5_9FUNG|nr:hypothetical protein INT47_013248 [Mucor saturninus]